MAHYRRIFLDDSSDDGDNNNDSSNSDKDFHDAVNDINESDDEDSDSNIQNISGLLETLSFKKRNTYGYRVDRTDDDETASNDEENTYLEDSFVVKDYTSPEVSSEEYSSNMSNDRKAFKKKRSTHNQQRQKMAQNSIDKKTTELSSFFRSAASVDNEEVSALLDLYPELKENVDHKGNSLNNDSIEEHSDSAKLDGDSDEKFEKYLDEVKTQSYTTKIYETRDLDGFIMTDSESINFSSEYETNSSDSSSDVHLIEKRQERHTDSILESQSASNIQKKSLQDDDEVFLLALSENGPVHQIAQKYTATKFSRIRQELTAKLFDIYRRRCFENKLDPNMILEWNARLRLTAGRCRCKPNGTADIELSVKVCDTPERLRDTLLHEMCHAAVWVIDRIRKGGHGPAWKYWVYQCQKVFPSLPLIERCHNYIIDAKYLYICDRCGQTIKRHSKSIDTDRRICGICQGHFILRSRDGKEFPARPANTFAQFVKENYRRERKPGVKPAEIMKILSLRFKEEKGKVSKRPEIITVE